VRAPTPRIGKFAPGTKSPVKQPAPRKLPVAKPKPVLAPPGLINR
jgi:hypothetical protein